MKVELLRVEDVFDLTNQGLVCAPFFQSPMKGQFQNFTATVTILPPELPAFDVSASFNVTQLKILDMTAPAEKRWQIITCLGKIPKESVPIGSVILCDNDVKMRLRQGT